jgi:hypothetical protein
MVLTPTALPAFTAQAVGLFPPDFFQPFFILFNVAIPGFSVFYELAVI